jgi:hypothetical protein
MLLYGSFFKSAFGCLLSHVFIACSGSLEIGFCSGHQTVRFIMLTHTQFIAFIFENSGSGQDRTRDANDPVLPNDPIEF